MIKTEEPILRPHDVLVEVRASTINIDDIHIAEGTFFGGIPIGSRPTPQSPVIPGSDLAGTVVDVGSNVQKFRKGDLVFGVQLPFRRGGAWAEYCAVNEGWLTKKPENLDFGTAAACGVSGLVALYAINALDIHEGDRVVIVGASGGIGGMAAQLALRAGARVIGVCGSQNVKRAYLLGCSLVLDYKVGPWDEALRRTSESRVDGVADLVGGEETEQMGRRVLTKNGKFVTVVGPERFVGDRALGWAGLLKLCAGIGFRIVCSYVRGPRYILTGPGAGGGSKLGEVASAAEAGVLPLIDSRVPFRLEAIQGALRRAATHQNNGRIVVDMNSER